MKTKHGDDDEGTRQRQIEALKAAAATWKDSDHPELKQDSEDWVRELRRESERHFQKQTRS